MKKNAQSAALQYTHGRFIAGDPEQNASYEQELFNIEVATFTSTNGSPENGKHHSTVAGKKDIECLPIAVRGLDDFVGNAVQFLLHFVELAAHEALDREDRVLRCWPAMQWWTEESLNSVPHQTQPQIIFGLDGQLETQSCNAITKNY